MISKWMKFWQIKFKGLQGLSKRQRLNVSVYSGKIPAAACEFKKGSEKCFKDHYILLQDLERVFL